MLGRRGEDCSGEGELEQLSRICGRWHEMVWFGAHGNAELARPRDNGRSC